MSESTFGCGCPPTQAVADGGVHHVIINVSDLDRSKEFYSWLLPRLGYPAVWDLAEEKSLGFLGRAGSFWVKQARVAGEPFHKDRVGLCEIAFRAENRAQIDALHRDLVARG